MLNLCFLILLCVTPALQSWSCPARALLGFIILNNIVTVLERVKFSKLQSKCASSRSCIRAGWPTLKSGKTALNDKTKKTQTTAPSFSGVFPLVNTNQPAQMDTLPPAHLPYNILPNFTHIQNYEAKQSTGQTGPRLQHKHNTHKNKKAQIQQWLPNIVCPAIVIRHSQVLH